MHPQDSHISTKELPEKENSFSGSFLLLIFEIILDGTGGAAVEMKNIAAETVTVAVDGAADVVLSGTADRLDTEINGAGVLESGALTVRQGAVTVNGVGTADVSCTETLNVEINGAGTVQYRGEPELTKTINGLGTVSKLPDETS